jgi:gliding motility-associated-like protein
MAGTYKLMRLPKLVITAMSTLLLLLGCAPDTFGQEAVGNSMTFVVPFAASAQDNDMTIYMCTGARAANVTVTTYFDDAESIQVYHILPNSSVAIPPVNKDIKLFATATLRELFVRRSVRIHSDMPISAYAHYYMDNGSGSTTLIPVRKWGTFYRIMDAPYERNSIVTLAAAYNNTVIEITPTQLTSGDKPAGQPYAITLNKGEVYQLRLSGIKNMAREFTGTTIRTIPNSYGITYPVGVYGGSLNLLVVSAPGVSGWSADVETEQLPTVCRWGQRFLTVPYASSAPGAAIGDVEYTIYRVTVDNPATIVKRNGIVLTGLVNNTYYEYVSNEADYLEADGKIMVTENMFTQKDPTYPLMGGGDGEVLVLSPMDDALQRADFYLTDKTNVVYHYLSLCVPTSALGSLTINGGTGFYNTYTHPHKPDYTVVIKRWGKLASHCTVLCNAPFSGICYGLASDKQIGAESLAFDITPLFHPEGDAMLTEKGENGFMKNTLCVKDSFRLVLKTEFLPVKMEWELKNYPGLFPNDQNVTVLNPVPDSTVARDGHVYHYFALPQYYTLTKPGDYAIPVNVTSPLITYCSQTQTFIAALTALATPVADFSYTSSGCIPFDVKFTAGSVGDTSVITAWKWDFTDKQFSTRTADYTYNTTGDKSVYLQVTARNGCSDDTLRVINLKEAQKPVPAFQLPGIVCLPYDTAKFVNKSTYTGTAPNGLSWKWDFGDLTTGTVKDPAHVYTTARAYQVKLIAIASDGCKDSISQELTSLKNGPKAAFDQSSSQLCTGETLTLTDRSVPAGGSAITQWNWRLGDGSSSTLKNAVKKYSQPGTPFTISHFVINQDGCVSDTATAPVNVYDVPRVEAGPDKVVLQGNTVQLQGSVAVAGMATIKWSPSTWLNADNIPAPYVTPQADQLYYITVTSGKCSAYDSVRVKVLPELVMPNAFSPNGDGNHDLWDIPGLNTYSTAVVQVFNRYGQKVFESKGYAVPWDGTLQGKQLPSGTYYYVIHPGEGKPAQTGPVTILR